MPQVQRFVASGQITPRGAMVPMDPGIARLGAVGREAADAGWAAGQAITLAVNKQQEARAAVELMKANTAATRELDDLSFNIEREGDWRAGAQRFDQGAQAAIAKHAQSIGDENTRTAFQAHAQSLAESRRVSLRNSLFRQEAGDAVAALDDTLEAQARTAAGAANPLVRDQAIASGAGAIKTLRDGGYIAPVEAGTKLRQFKSRIDETEIRSVLTEDPAAAVRVLNDPRMLPNMLPDKRVMLLDMAIRRQDSLVRAEEARQSRLDRDAERVLKQAGEDAAKDLWARWAKGGQLGAGNVAQPALTVADIDARRKVLSQGDYTALVKQVRGDDGRDDKDTIAGLTLRLDREDVESDAYNALKRGDLTSTTYRDIVSKNRIALKDDRPASPYKSGRELVNTTLKPPELLGQGAAQDAARAAQAQALVEFDNWSDANKGASRAASIEEAQGIIRRYQVIQFDTMSLGVGLPRAYRGDRRAIAAGDLDVAERETLDGLDAGAVTKEQAAQELRKIGAWREILARKAAPAPGKGAAK